MVQIDVSTVSGAMNADAECLAAACRGDTAAFRAIVSRHSPHIYRYVKAMTHDPNDCEDIVQEVFLVLWRRRAQVIVIGDSLRPWLLVTARYTASNLRRAHLKRSTEPLDADAQSTEPGPEHRLLTLEQVHALQSAIDALSPADRAVARLCLIDELSYKEAAAELSTSTGSIRNRLHRLRRILQVQLADLRGVSDD